MIKSMTGYGSAKGVSDGFEISVELKSVNNRYLDVSVRLPRSFAFAEESVKSAVSSCVSRGKVDVFVTVNNTNADGVIVTVNDALARGYIKALRVLSEKYELGDDVTASTICRFPDVLSIEKKEADKDAVTAAIYDITKAALCEMDAMRVREGMALKTDISARADTIERLTNVIAARSPLTLAEYRARLEQNMREVLDSRDIDEGRLLTEVAIFADKIAIDEEMVRLRSHLAQLREMLAGGSPIGRKLDFLIQELNREANTTGSKCNDPEVTMTVVELKSEIEKIREQVQNIE